MNKTNMVYFKDDDVIHIVIAEGNESGSVEISPNITVELDDKGEIIGIEILKASDFLRDSILDSAQAKLLSITKTSNKRMHFTGNSEARIHTDK